MKHKIVTLISFVLLSLVSLAWIGPAVAGNEEGPRLSFSETDYDFGILAPGDEAIHYFVFTNTGDKPLVIINVRTSCGCMASDWNKKPVGAGVKDSLKVEYNTKIKGTFSKAITVQSNALNSSVDLNIRGNVVKSK
ncbi:MAG: DUF1573 domain-containing protein [Bacteroidales bacterium]|nr:DUF1573 domain-containing protein [Bacteroidales bacterium]HOC48540.1 DUF1573 domain-containing protein [Bacteroidales bacterium]